MTEQDVAGPSILIAESSAPAIPSITAVPFSSALAEALDVSLQEQDVGPTLQVLPLQSKTPRPAEEQSESGRPPKRQRVQAPVVETTLSQPVAIPNEASPIPQDNSPSRLEALLVPILAPEQLASDTTQVITSAIATTSANDAPIEGSRSATQELGPDEATASDAPTPSQSRKGRRRLPWATVNQPHDGEEGIVETGASIGTRTRGTAKARSKREVAASVNNDNDAQVDSEKEGEDNRAAPKRPGAKPRGKRTATAAGDGETTGASHTTKKPRKTRKDKGTTRRKESGLEGDGENNGAVSENPAHPNKKKAVRKAKKTTTPTVETGEDVEGDAADREQPKKRKGRPPREATPSGAEDEEIEPETTLMTQLATRNIRVGKLSEREKRMREINWEEVRQRRLEEEANAVERAREARNQVDEALAQAGKAREEAAQQNSGPQLREIDGQIVLVQDSGTIDREADADRAIELMEQVDEDDLTVRINGGSFLRDNKRFPQDFMLPGQGRRWTKEGTELFYEALGKWGTDFDTISTIFPGTTRKSIRKKFNREERADPARIDAVLRAPKAPDWDEYLTLSGRTNDSFVDVAAINKELEEMKMQTAIAVKEAEAVREEEKRQRRLAGAELSEDEPVNGSAKENAKKKKKGKGKEMHFTQDDNVEVLGGVDDNWLQGAQ